MAGPDIDFWQARFDSGTTPWDRGVANPQLAAWIESGQLAPCRVLVPGCGSGHEVAVLAAAGFDVTALDYTPAAARRARARVSSLAPSAAHRVQVIQTDALHWAPESAFDAVYEQGCLCALYPDSWAEYAQRLRLWLRPGGQLFVLFMQAPRPESADGRILGPPYHCDINGMRALFPRRCWDWPKPPYATIEHPAGLAELAVRLVRH